MNSRYGLGWRELNVLEEGYWEEKSTWPKQITNVLLALVIFYLIIGFFSLLAIAHGYHFSYMPFWHEPWRWLFNLAGLLPNLPKEVIPNGGIPV